MSFTLPEAYIKDDDFFYGYYAYSGINNRPNARIESIGIYPIPFKPQNNNLLAIEYELDNFGPVQLEIFNVLGQLVFSRYDELGGGSFHWDGTNYQGTQLASGFYIVSLKTKKSKIYRRLLLIR